MKEKTNFKLIATTALVTALVVGGAFHYHQQVKSLENEVGNLQVQLQQKEGNKEIKTAKTPQEKVAKKPMKSMADYYQMKDNYNVTAQFSLKSPEEAGFKTVGSFTATCPEVTDGLCGGNVLILTKDSSSNELKEFYLGITGGAMFDYYGPFTDYLDELVEETSETVEVK